MVTLRYRTPCVCQAAGPLPQAPFVLGRKRVRVALSVVMCTRDTSTRVSVLVYNRGAASSLHYVIGAGRTVALQIFQSFRRLALVTDNGGGVDMTCAVARYGPERSSQLEKQKTHHTTRNLKHIVIDMRDARTHTHTYKLDSNGYCHGVCSLHICLLPELLLVSPVASSLMLVLIVPLSPTLLLPEAAW